MYNEKESVQVRQKKIIGLRMRAERVRQEKMAADSATLSPSRKKGRLNKELTSARTVGDIGGSTNGQG